MIQVQALRAPRGHAGWIDVSEPATAHNLPGKLMMSEGAWFVAVYFVAEPVDRYDIAREQLRLHRVLAEIAKAAAKMPANHEGDAAEFEVLLPENVDRFSGATLPRAELLVRVATEAARISYWIDLAPRPEDPRMQMFVPRLAA
ncbi:MAG: hypothetical protein ACKVP2_04380 [Burkholderiales bacterium]